jgi:hypothetical protein
MSLRVPLNAGNFLTGWGPVSFSRKTLLHRVIKMLLCAYAPRVYEMYEIRINSKQYWKSSSAGKARRRTHLESYIGTLFAKWMSNHSFTKASKIHTSYRSRSLFFLHHFLAYQFAFSKKFKKCKREVQSLERWMWHFFQDIPWFLSRGLVTFAF